MKIIADSGSTKCDWVILNTDWVETNRIETVGFNPFFYTAEAIATELNKNSFLQEVKNTVSSIHFYGAGCSSSQHCAIIENGLKQVFPKAIITVEHDIKASALATYNGNPAITCINGTGSNACYFDGETIQQGNPSLGYILGDEASGNYFGKKLIQAYFYQQLPKNIHKEFEHQFNVAYAELIKHIYELPRANKYLASFFPFIVKHKAASFFQKMIAEGFTEFFENQVYVLLDREKNNSQVETHDRTTEINFVGSVAFLLKEEVEQIAETLDLKTGVFIQKPIDGLVDYHKNLDIP